MTDLSKILDKAKELEAKMKQIISDYAPILEAKPIEEIKAEVKRIEVKDKKGLKPIIEDSFSTLILLTLVL